MRRRSQCAAIGLRVSDRRGSYAAALLVECVGMTSGHLYGEQEPKERCPYCRSLCCADFVDVGVGYQQCGPFHCERCGASQIGPYDKERALTDIEDETGWYAPNTQPGSSANVDQSGRIIRYFEADTLYRTSLGVAPRYDSNGRLI